RLKGHIEMIVDHKTPEPSISLDEIRHGFDNEQYAKRLADGLLEQIKYSKELEENNKKLRLELSTLRFKESQEQRYIWWIWNVYARNVDDLCHAIMGATTYDTEGEAKDGKYGLPKHCFDLMKRIDEHTEHIYDGTYLDVEISTDVKRDLSDAEIEELGAQEAESRAEPSQSDSSVTQNNTNHNYNNH
ncbi:MAG: hypothetical protein WC428_08350, partial [Candidatus Paceibacterota bacterium]